MRDPLSESEHRGVRDTLRVAGPILAAVGGLLLVVSLIDFFAAFGSFGRQPRFFWMGFLGMPLLAVGLGMTKWGFAGKIARYAGREIGPAAGHTFNDVARIARSGVRDATRAVREGMGGSASAGVAGCGSCGSENDEDAKFCRACGRPMELDRRCGACGHPAAGDARFCDDCGVELPVA